MEVGAVTVSCDAGEFQQLMPPDSRNWPLDVVLICSSSSSFLHQIMQRLSSWSAEQLYARYFIYALQRIFSTLAAVASCNEYKPVNVKKG